MNQREVKAPDLSRQPMGGDYVTRVLPSVLELPAALWDGLLDQQDQPTPFMRHDYLAALERSGCASASTGWHLQVLTLWSTGAANTELQAACLVYLKDHSWGEYVFDWAWAQAYQEHGLDYYPKALVAVPFTPVPGSRLLARDGRGRDALMQALLHWCQQQSVSSLHLLFGSPADQAAWQAAGLLQRQTVQFHWQRPVALASDSFEAFLATLNQEKRKKIRQERQKVARAGIHVSSYRGQQIRAQDWDLFYRCYQKTYEAHGNAPYLSLGFFREIATTQGEHWLMFIAERGGQPVACSLIGLSDSGPTPQRAYGRYWGALEAIDCLHFDLCYYQPLQWCLAHQVQVFEGGAQGEHKMARALLPTLTHSAHWLAHPAFADAVDRFLQREGQGMARYLEHLAQRSPLRRPAEPEATCQVQRAGDNPQ